MQPYKFIEFYTNFLLHIYMIPFIMLLILPHMLLKMLTVYLYQELEPPQQKAVSIFVVHKFETHLILYFIQQGHWLILNCYINHFYICNYEYNL